MPRRYRAAKPRRNDGDDNRHNAIVADTVAGIRYTLHADTDPGAREHLADTGVSS
jgi:hypothetical protein